MSISSFDMTTQILRWALKLKIWIKGADFPNHIFLISWSLSRNKLLTTLLTHIVSFSSADKIRIEYYETQRGAKGVYCQGHYFVKEKAFGRTINWHCMFKKKYGCGARGITNYSDPMMMRITRKFHNHDIEDKNFSILPISALFKWKKLWLKIYLLHRK